MLGTIRNWFFGRVLNRHRLLFRYWNGSRFVSEDPFILFRNLLNTQTFDPEMDVKIISEISDPKIIVKRIQRIAEGVREIFNVKPLADGGLSELECVQLLFQFTQWSEALKKNGVTSQISRSSFPATPAVPAAGSPVETSTSENSGSSLTSFESSISEPGQSQLESEPQPKVHPNNSSGP